MSGFLFLIIEIVVLMIIFFVEDFLIYKWIRKIDKKERQFLNEWEINHIKELLELKRESERETEE